MSESRVFAKWDIQHDLANPASEIAFLQIERRCESRVFSIEIYIQPQIGLPENVKSSFQLRIRRRVCTGFIIIKYRRYVRPGRGFFRFSGNRTFRHRFIEKSLVIEAEAGYGLAVARYGNTSER